MPIISLAIDPGISGAIALFHGSEFRGIQDMPIRPGRTTSGKKKRKRNEVDPWAFAEFVKKSGAHQAFLEDVHAMPRDGVVGAFSFGRSLGVLEGVLAANDVDTIIVRPNDWTSCFSVYDKDHARRIVAKMLPRDATMFQRKKDSGRADAVLIGRYGLRRQEGST